MSVCLKTTDCVHKLQNGKKVGPGVAQPSNVVDVLLSLQTVILMCLHYMKENKRESC